MLSFYEYLNLLFKENGVLLVLNEIILVLVLMFVIRPAKYEFPKLYPYGNIFIVLFGFFLVCVNVNEKYQAYTHQYTICHDENAVKNEYMYKNGYCYRKFSGYIGVDNSTLIIDGEVKEQK